MAYHFDSYDNSLVIDGFGKGIADSPFDGIADIRNMNLISVPGEASVNFATQAIMSPYVIGSVTSADIATDTITFTGGSGLEDGMCITFTATTGLAGISTAAGNKYWVFSTTSTTAKLYSAPNTDPFFLVNITSTGTGTFNSYTISTPKHFVWTGANNYMVDNLGQVWSDLVPTSTNSYWGFCGNTTPTGTTPGACGNGLVFLQNFKSTTTYGAGDGYLFVFRNSAIDFVNAGDTTMAWTYGWKPSDASTGNNPGYLHTPPGTDNSHEAMLMPTNQIVYCDKSFVGRFYQKNIATLFDPLTAATYVFDETALLPGEDIAQCLAYLGTNIMVGSNKNVIYPWNGVSTTFSYPILLAENNVQKMITINTNTYIFIGNRGRIYYTNGTNVQLYKKVPDHISGTVEPYYVWGGACVQKNQLYFGALCTTNGGTEVNQYGGIWAIDVDTNAIRLVNQLSYGTYAGYVSAILPNFATNPGGAGLYAGWRGVANRSFTDGQFTGTTTLVSATANFTQADVGRAVSGTNIEPLTSIRSVTNSTTVILNHNVSSAVKSVPTSANKSITLYSNGLDTTISTPYIGSQATIDSDLIPIGTWEKTRDFGKIEYKLTRPLVAGESVVIKTRKVFDTEDTGYTALSNLSGGAGDYSGIGDSNFKNAQWVQLQAVLNSTATNPSYVRLKEMRLKGLVGSSPQQTPLLTL